MPAAWKTHDEPVIEGGDIEWCGDQLIYVVDRTAAGFAYGVPVAEMRRGVERDARGAGWARAKRVLRELVEREVGKVDDIGWVKKIGDGLSREIFASEVEFVDRRREAYVVALPRVDAEPGLDDRTRRELRLIARLRTRSLGCREARLDPRRPTELRRAPDMRNAAMVMASLS